MTAVTPVCSRAALVRACGMSIFPLLLSLLPSQSPPAEHKGLQGLFLLGAEFDNDRRTEDGRRSASPWAAVGKAGVGMEGARTFSGRSVLLELDLLGEVKAGAGRHTYPETPNLRVALGIHLSGEADLGFLLSDTGCTLYLGGGAAFLLRAIGIFGEGSAHGPSIATPDGHGEISARAGPGFACVDEASLLLVVPYGAVLASGYGSGFAGGARASYRLIGGFSVDADAHYAVTSEPRVDDYKELSVEVGAKIHLGFFWVGGSARLRNADRYHHGGEITPGNRLPDFERGSLRTGIAVTFGGAF
jgi:hypothetical protein